MKKRVFEIKLDLPVSLQAANLRLHSFGTFPEWSFWLAHALVYCLPAACLGPASNLASFSRGSILISQQYLAAGDYSQTNHA